MATSTSTTLYDVNVYVDGRWEQSMSSSSKKEAVERGKLLDEMGKKWVIWKRTERTEMIGKSVI